MIQRIQSIYLLLVICLGVISFFVPYMNLYVDDHMIASIKTSGVEFSQNASITADINMFLLSLNIMIIIVLSLIAIFLFKKRKLQMMFVKLNLIFVIISIVTMFLYADIIKTAINAMKSYYFGSAFPLISLVLLYLALKSISKDEELIKAADRLR